jgi:methionine-rich copper-binding protein CopC
MKKLMLLVSAIAAGFTTAAQADISISGSAGLGYVSGNTNVSDVYTGGAISFALSSTLDNGVTVSTSAGIRMDTNDTKTTVATKTTSTVKSVYQLATGFTAITFASGNNSLTWGMDVGLAGEGSGGVGGVASDLVDEGGYARDNSAGMAQDSGGGVAVSTVVGDASISATFLAQLPTQLEGSNEVRFGDSADTTATGLSISMPMGALAITAGYADVENTETQSGVKAAYAMAGGTLTVGYTQVDNNSGSDESAWGATYSTTLGSATLKVGHNNAKVGTYTGSQTEVQLSQSLGGGASVYAELQTMNDSSGSNATTDGSNIAIGTKYAF